MVRDPGAPENNSTILLRYVEAFTDIGSWVPCVDSKQPIVIGDERIVAV